MLGKLGFPLLILILGPIAGASLAAAPRPADPEATMVDELVVTARTGGPAWWKVSSATATVYVLGLPGAAPKGLKWDQTVLRRHLRGARLLIGPPTVTAGIGDLFTIIRLRGHFRAKGPMENTLPADLRARYLADRARLSTDRRAYSGWTPLVAGLLMIQDFRKTARLDPFEPAGTIRRVAEGMGVKFVPAGSYKAVPLMRAAETGLAEEGPACLTDALDEIEAGAERVRAAAEGWARGDVSAALSAQRGYEKCLASLPEGADLATKSMNDATEAIAGALAQPGHAVAVVNLRTLLAHGGVLQRLQARGFRVTTPDKG